MRYFKLDLGTRTGQIVTYVIGAFNAEEAMQIANRIAFVQIQNPDGEKYETGQIPEEGVSEPTPEEVERLNKLFGI